MYDFNDIERFAVIGFIVIGAIVVGLVLHHFII